MLHLKSFPLKLTLVLFVVIAMWGCNNNSIPIEPEDSADKAALEKLISEDESIQSFEPNYNEEQAMSFVTNGLSKAISPLKVGRRMKMVERNLNVVFEGDSAFGILTKRFEGILYVAGTFDEPVTDSSQVDTLVEKLFSAVVTRNILFKKVNNSDKPFKNWRIIAISLPEGETENSAQNISITKVSINTANGDTLVIESPNEYFLNRHPGLRRQIPVMGRHEDVTVTLEVQSIYPDEDFATLTYGAHRLGKHFRVKRRFELVSEEFDGTYYNRVYKNIWKSNMSPGYKHAIITVMPKQVIYDTDTPVEANSWGVPYIIY